MTAIENIEASGFWAAALTAFAALVDLRFDKNTKEIRRYFTKTRRAILSLKLQEKSDNFITDILDWLHNVPKGCNETFTVYLFGAYVTFCFTFFKVAAFVNLQGVPLSTKLETYSIHALLAGLFGGVVFMGCRSYLQWARHTHVFFIVISIFLIKIMYFTALLITACIFLTLAIIFGIYFLIYYGIPTELNQIFARAYGGEVVILMQYGCPTAIGFLFLTIYALQINAFLWILAKSTYILDRGINRLLRKHKDFYFSTSVLAIGALVTAVVTVVNLLPVEVLNWIYFFWNPMFKSAF